MVIKRCIAEHADAWAVLRQALWPTGSVQKHRTDIEQALNSDPDHKINLIARMPDGEYAGFAEASLRHDYVNGCGTSPVAFLEGIYVAPAYRKTGVARALVAAIENWARTRKCTEFASDTDLHNISSHMMHNALGFEETERVVFFRKSL